MKYIVIIPDGMADRPLEELGNRTPLEAARTTNMDYLAQNGCVGMVRTIPENMAPGSDVGNMSIMGYNPSKDLTGRGPLEAANLGIDMADDEIAFRCNLVTVMDGKMSDYSAGHILTEEAKIIIQTLNEEIAEERMRFIAGKSYRHVLVMKVTDPKKYLKIQTTPPHDILGKHFKPFLPKGSECKVLLKLMEKSQSVLEHHAVNTVRADLKENPANMIWLWGQGGKPHLPRFKKKFGIQGGIISAVDLVNGIGRLAGLENIDVPGITGYYDTNFQGKANYAIEALKHLDFTFIHIEAPDEASHNGDVKAKIAAIERIDQDILGTILNAFDIHDDIRILVLPDHPTPVALRTHTSAPVCFVMFGKNIAHNGADAFTEAHAMKTGLTLNNGEDLLNMFIKKHL